VRIEVLKPLWKKLGGPSAYMSARGNRLTSDF